MHYIEIKNERSYSVWGLDLITFYMFLCEGGVDDSSGNVVSVAHVICHR